VHHPRRLTRTSFGTRPQVIKAVLLHGMVSLRATHGAAPPQMDTLRQLAAAASATLLGDSPPAEPSPRDVQSLQTTQLLLKATTDAAAHVVKVRPRLRSLAPRPGCTSTRREWQRADPALVLQLPRIPGRLHASVLGACWAAVGSAGDD